MTYGDVSGLAAGEDMEVGVNGDAGSQVSAGGLGAEGVESLGEFLLIGTRRNSTASSLSSGNGASGSKAGEEDGETHVERMFFFYEDRDISQ